MPAARRFTVTPLMRYASLRTSTVLRSKTYCNIYSAKTDCELGINIYIAPAMQVVETNQLRLNSY